MRVVTPATESEVHGWMYEMVGERCPGEQKEEGGVKLANHALPLA
jgi:hypothetical protein